MQIIPLIQNPSYYLVIPRFNKAFVMSKEGELVYTFETEKEEKQFIGGCISIHVLYQDVLYDYQGKYLYCMCDDGYRYCFTAEDGELVEKKKLVDYEVLGIVHSPNANEMILYSQKGEIIQWRT